MGDRRDTSLPTFHLGDVQVAVWRMLWHHVLYLVPFNYWTVIAPLTGIRIYSRTIINAHGLQNLNFSTGAIDAWPDHDCLSCNVNKSSIRYGGFTNYSVHKPLWRTNVQTGRLWRLYFSFTAFSSKNLPVEFICCCFTTLFTLSPWHVLAHSCVSAFSAFLNSLYLSPDIE